MTSPATRDRQRKATASAFSLLELLVVIGVIAVLVALLGTSLSRSRAQAKGAHCLARMKEIGTAFGTYASDNSDKLPPLVVDWHPQQVTFMAEQGIDRCRLPVMYGWAELLYEHVYPGSSKLDWSNFPAQRNYDGRYAGYFNCAGAGTTVSHAGHYRPYGISWSQPALLFDDTRRLIGQQRGAAALSPTLSSMRPHWVLAGDSNDESDGGDYRGDPIYPAAECTNTEDEDAQEFSALGLAQLGGTIYNSANSRVSGRASNNFARRHGDSPNILFGDLHAERNLEIVRRLACDWNLDGIEDPITEDQRELSGCGQ